uniref:Reverse transcriptase domain-containing protein n=1 Tax=Chenopodium quinoa TaxID=63459 RepID=A0A803LNG9_CHEQI
MGSDGYHPFFYKKFWDTINLDLTSFIRNIYEDKAIPASINKTLIAIIPKISEPTSISQFRPISPCNTVYKIVTKIIANRLRGFLPSRISPNQNSFLPGRGIKTNVIVVNEVLHSMKKRKGKKDLPSIELIMTCVSSVTSSVLVNGIPTENFNPSRGIRQDRKTWSPFGMGSKQVPISHLFADDILLFGETSLENILSLKDTFDTFCAFSSQTISVLKSRVLFSRNTSQNDRNLFCDATSFRETDDLSPYLGFPISSSRPSKNRVKLICDKILKKLDSWKAAILSKVGRSCLVSATLNTLPNYYMQCMLMPCSLLNSLNSSLAKFLWGKGENSRGLHLVGWDHIARPKESGGLGIRCFKALNKAHLLKLWWRTSNQEGNLAVQVLKDKYSKPNNQFRAFSAGSHLWNSMGKV